MAPSDLSFWHSIQEDLTQSTAVDLGGITTLAYLEQCFARLVGNGEDRVFISRVLLEDIEQASFTQCLLPGPRVEVETATCTEN